MLKMGSFVGLTFSFAFGFAQLSNAATFSLNTTVPGSEVTINGGIFGAFTTGSGSGVYRRLYGIQNNPTEQGFNTVSSVSGTSFDNKNGNFDPVLELGDFPVVFRNGVPYFQVLFDINEGGNDSSITLRQFQFYLYADPNNIYTSTNSAGAPNIGTVNTEFNQNTTVSNMPTLGTLIYNMDGNADNTLNITIATGSGASNMQLLMPVSSVLPYISLGDPLNPNNYTMSSYNVHLFVQFTNASSGFEEVAVSTRDGGIPFSQIPEGDTLWGGMAIAFFLIGSFIYRRFNQATGGQRVENLAISPAN